MKVKMQLDIGEDEITMYINRGCLKSNWKETVEGHPMLEIFPDAQDENTILGSMGIDFSKAIVKVLSDEEFDKRFPQEDEEEVPE